MILLAGTVIFSIASEYSANELEVTLLGNGSGLHCFRSLLRDKELMLSADGYTILIYLDFPIFVSAQECG